MLKLLKQKILLLFNNTITRTFLNTKAIKHHNIYSTKRNQLQLFTIAFDNPTVIELQLQLLRYFVKDDFQYIVADNSPTPKMRACIENICVHYNAGYISLPHNPWTGIHNSMSHGTSLNWIVTHILPKSTSKFVGFLDHDVFPIRQIRICDLLTTNTYYGLLQKRENAQPYLWPGFIFFPRNIINYTTLDFRPDHNGDTGTRLAHLFINTDCTIALCSEFYENFLSQPVEAQDNSYSVLDNSWVHTRNAAYWLPEQKKEHLILQVLKEKTGIKKLSIDVTQNFIT